jgi:hypothetical protein
VLVISYASVPSSPVIIQIPLTINDITNVGTLIIKVNICINSRTAISLFIVISKLKSSAGCYLSGIGARKHCG